MKKLFKERINKEKVRATTEEVLERANQFALEAHKRHVTIKDRRHRPLAIFPMTLGIAAVLALPVVATIGLAAFLINDWQVAVEKREEK